MSAIAAFIREKRLASKLSQVKLADKVGCCRFSLIKMESGRQIPKYDMVVAICQVLQVAPIELLLLISEHYERAATRFVPETQTIEDSGPQG